MMIAALMLGVGAGSFAIVPLRALLSLDALYRLSSLYPACALLIAAWLLRVPGRSEAEQPRARQKPIRGL